MFTSAWNAAFFPASPFTFHLSTATQILNYAAKINSIGTERILQDLQPDTPVQKYNSSRLKPWLCLGEISVREHSSHMIYWNSFQYKAGESPGLHSHMLFLTENIRVVEEVGDTHTPAGRIRKITHAVFKETGRMLGGHGNEGHEGDKPKP